MSDAMSVSGSQRSPHARQRRINVIQTTKRHLGVGNLSPCGCSRRQRSMHRGTSNPHPPPSSPRGVTSQPALISSWGIKANIFLMEADLKRGGGRRQGALLTQRRDAALLSRYWSRAEMDLRHQVMVVYIQAGTKSQMRITRMKPVHHFGEIPKQLFPICSSRFPKLHAPFSETIIICGGGVHLAQLMSVSGYPMGETIGCGLPGPGTLPSTKATSENTKRRVTPSRTPARIQQQWEQTKKKNNKKVRKRRVHGTGCRLKPRKRGGGWLLI